MNIHNSILEYLYKNQDKGFMEISHICSDKKRATRIAKELKKEGLVTFKQKKLMGSGKTQPFKGHPRLEITKLGTEKYESEIRELNKTKVDNIRIDENTIQTLENLKNGNSVTLTKDSPNEISDLIINLKNFGIANKASRFGYAVEFKYRNHLTKLIELKSWTEFLEWLDNQKNESNISNDFSGSTIGQVNQSSEKVVVKKNKITQLDKLTNKTSFWVTIKSFLSKFWWMIIIPLAIGIILIMIERGFIDIGI